MSRSSKFRITQTLLANWLYVYKTDDGYEKFLKCLNREKEPPTQAMLDGIQFEGCVNSVLNGAPIQEDHKWYRPVMKLSQYLQGSQQQVTVFKDIRVGDTDFLLHGVLDFLRAGVIYDTKFSKTYELNKYFRSPQHPMYLELVPEAYEFQYLICDGKQIYRERYERPDVQPISYTIECFMNFLDRQNLIETYKNNWIVKGD